MIWANTSSFYYKENTCCCIPMYGIAEAKGQALSAALITMTTSMDVNEQATGRSTALLMEGLQNTLLAWA